MWRSPAVELGRSRISELTKAALAAAKIRGRPGWGDRCGWTGTSAVILFSPRRGGEDAMQEIADPLTAEGRAYCWSFCPMSMGSSTGVSVQGRMVLLDEHGAAGRCASDGTAGHPPSAPPPTRPYLQKKPNTAQTRTLPADPFGQALIHRAEPSAAMAHPDAHFLRTPWSNPIPPPAPARTRKTPPPRPASRARPPPPPPRFRTRSVSTPEGRVRKMIPVTVCAGCGPEVLSAPPLIQHRCDKVNTLVRDPAGFFCHSMISEVCPFPAPTLNLGSEPELCGTPPGRRPAEAVL